MQGELALHVVDWPEARAALMGVRTLVFVEEQGVPAELEADDRDPACQHLLAMQAGVPVGTARLDVEYGGKVGRVAVLAAQRGRGVGSQIMCALHDLARARGLQELWCHAQLSAVPFYERLGYRREGEEFLEAGIAHLVLRHRLDDGLRSRSANPAP